jgi:hypothetical protein
MKTYEHCYFRYILVTVCLRSWCYFDFMITGESFEISGSMKVTVFVGCSAV